MAPTDPSDEQLMAAYVGGDRPAFVLLFGRWAPRIRQIYLRYGLRPHEADDLVQQCFLQVHRARHDFRAGSTVKPWLLTIAINLARQSFRRRARKPETGFDTQAAEPQAAGADPDATLFGAVVHHALAQLSDTHREVIVLHWFEGLAFAEIAAIVGATTTAVKVRAHRGYAVLRARLEAAGVTASDARSYGGQG